MKSVCIFCAILVFALFSLSSGAIDSTSSVSAVVEWVDDSSQLNCLAPKIKSLADALNMLGWRSSDSLAAIQTKEAIILVRVLDVQTFEVLQSGLKGCASPYQRISWKYVGEPSLKCTELPMTINSHFDTKVWGWRSPSGEVLTQRARLDVTRYHLKVESGKLARIEAVFSSDEDAKEKAKPVRVVVNAP